MNKHLWFKVLCVLLIAVSLSACDLIGGISEVNTDDLEKLVTDGKELAEGAVDLAGDAMSYIDENAPYAKIIARASEWVVDGVPYGYIDADPSDDYQDRYRTNSPGFASYAWLLQDANGKRISVDAADLASYATQIAFDDLKPGDIVNNLRPGDEGHVVMFVSWVPGTNNSKFVALEMSRSEGKAIQTTLSLRVDDNGGRFIKEYEDTIAGPYVALRLNELVEAEDSVSE